MTDDTKPASATEETAPDEGGRFQVLSCNGVTELFVNGCRVPFESLKLEADSEGNRLTLVLTNVEAEVQR